MKLRKNLLAALFAGLMAVSTVACSADGGGTTEGGATEDLGGAATEMMTEPLATES